MNFSALAARPLTYLATVLAVSTTALFAPGAHAKDARGETKEWAILVFMNGHNNLDSFTTMNLKEIEKIGSTASTHVVVQWASAAAATTKRLYMEKSTDPSNVTSTVVQDLPRVDMGDYKQLVEFVRWAKENYPAKHYMIDVWDHGNGWKAADTSTIFRDLSYDDSSGNHITTEQLGLAMNDIKGVLGKNVDVFGTDACLMAMLEVAGEMQGTVDYYIGSQDLEPGAGWPYDGILNSFEASADKSPAALSRIVSDEYVKSYQAGTHGSGTATYSAWDMSKFANVEKAVGALATSFAGLDANATSAARTAIGQSANFYFSDYVDLGDVLKQTMLTNTSVDTAAVAAAKAALGEFVVHNADTADRSASTGVSVWIPTSKYSYSTLATRYSGLQFAKATGWDKALAHIAQ
jgi:hypothetical protein